MPATEQTWRDSKALHLVFGLTALAMLGTTIWMLAADHNREWKDYQRKFQKVETWTAESRIREQETGAYEAQKKELEEQLEEVRAKPVPLDVVDAFIERARPKAQTNGYDLKAVENAKEKLPGPNAKRDERIARRHDLLEAMEEVTRKAKFIEARRSGELKFERANLDVARSEYSIGIDEGLPEQSLSKTEERVKKIEASVEEKTLAAQTAKTDRLDLEAILAKMTAEELVAIKKLETHQSTLKQLQISYDERRPNLGKAILELPIIDAFGRPLKIDNLWLPQLTFNNNFRDVARFDRCTTCHQGIEKTAAGSAIEPGYEPIQRLTLKLETPKEAPKPTKDEAGEVHPATVQDVYGMVLADQGLVNASDVTIEVVWPQTPAAMAMLESGDVIEFINGVKILDRNAAQRYLLQSVSWGKPLSISVRRGVPEPFNSHPRLDLFVGSMSPHKLGDFGCTICHEGQGSATGFKWASHTPNTPDEAEDWCVRTAGSTTIIGSIR